MEREDGVLENTGDWVIEDGENFSYTNKTIIINGNLTVNGTLSLTGCDLIMNRTSTTLKVNGELHLIDTNISGNSTYYYFMVYGIMNSLNSNFTDMIGSSTPPYVGGLQVYSEDVVIDGGIIYNNTRDNDYSFTGLYIQSNITVRNLTIQDNEFNVVVNGSAPEFHNCTIRSPVGVTLYMVNGASPSFIEGVPEGEKMFEDEASSFNICHLLSVHVILENGTAVPGAAVRARSRIGLVKNGITDSTGWVRNIVLINYTSHKSGGDTVHVPYVVSAKKFGLQVQKETELLLYTTTVLELILVGDSFGYSLIRGDFNGDSLLDLVVGVPGNTSGTRVPGAVFVYLNNGGLELRELNEGMADLTIEGVDGSGFGSTLAAG
ncbi:MAG: FG-GAP repeat protein, partial [Thermoplasmata archaeon]|nr:FG-GAP repeat protein [Thermoplasmata archaeon]